MKFFSWNLAGLIGAAFLLVALTSAAAQSGAPEPQAHLLDWIGLSGVVAIVGWAIQWGEHKEFKKATLARLESVDVAFLRTERWDDHREVLERQHREILERIENLHRSVQTIRREQLERVHGLTERDGGV